MEGTELNKEQRNNVRSRINDCLTKLPRDTQAKVAIAIRLYKQSALIDPIPSTLGMVLAALDLLEAMENEAEKLKLK